MERTLKITLLTAGRDKPYAYGMSKALIAQGLSVDIVGGDDLDSAEWSDLPLANYLNLKGDARPDASLLTKASRILLYYARLIRYAAAAHAELFHILWNNKFETFDRVPLMLYYKLLGKKLLLTVHNVNARKRDGNDTWLNRLTLKIQYHLADHLFVHTEQMKKDLVDQFAVPLSAITVIPFGLNNAVPETGLSLEEARSRLDLAREDRVILFFGNIAPYKGLEYLVDAFQQLNARGNGYRLIIAGNPKNCESYWNSVQDSLQRHVNRDRILQRSEYIPDDETEVYFKSADVLVLPYRYIYQSGVLFLGYSFGLPVIATDVGSLREDIIEGKTGFVCKPDNAADLTRAIEMYFASELFLNLNHRRQEIRDHAHQRYSWDVVGQITKDIYERLSKGSCK
jgi:glycosyltransferase involved in cell wall biosynthesis